MYNYKFSK